MKKFFGFTLISFCALILAACSFFQDNDSTSSSGKVTFAINQARAITSTAGSLDSYTYSLKGTFSGKERTFLDKATYSQFAAASLGLDYGSWSFTLTALRGDIPVYSGKKEIDLTQAGALVSFTINAVSGGTASLSVKLNYPENKGVAKVTAGLYESITARDDGEELTLNNSYVTFTTSTVPSGVNRFVKFFLYDSQDTKIASFTESVYMTASDSIEVERTLSNVNTFTGTVLLKEFGYDWVDSGMTIKAVSGSKEYIMTSTAGTNIYTASLPLGTYDIYSGSEDTGLDLTVVFDESGSVTVDFSNGLMCTITNLETRISNLTGEATIVLTGEVTQDDTETLVNAIRNSNIKINLDLSKVTGLTDCPNFEECTTLKSIILPDYMTTMGGCCFRYCTSLELISIGSSLQLRYGPVTTPAGYYIEHLLYDQMNLEGCTSLKTLVIDSDIIIHHLFENPLESLETIIYGDTLQSISGSIVSYGDIDYLPALKKIYIGKSISSIVSDAFAGLDNLETIEVSEENNNFISENGVLYNKDKTTLICYPAGKKDSSYIIPDSVTSIGEYAFYKCTSLSSVTIPDSVTSVGAYAFNGCTSLESVTIPDSVTSIGDRAFFCCTNLTSLTFKDTTTWYRTNSSSNWSSKTGGTLTDLSVPETNATYFKSTYFGYYWYKLDE